MNRQLTAIIEREEDGYVALCPELDIASQGDTIEMARKNLREALELFFETASPEEIKQRLHEEIYVTRRLPLAKLKILSGKDVCQILAKHGFVEVRRRGSHLVMQKKLPESTITVPIPDHAELRIGTLQSIIRQSGVSRSEFES